MNKKNHKWSLQLTVLLLLQTHRDMMQAFSCS
jgi:hypothetical protein